MRRGKVLAQPEMVRVPHRPCFLLPVKPSFARSPVSHHRASPSPFSIVIGARIAGHEGGSRKPGSGFS